MTTAVSPVCAGAIRAPEEALTLIRVYALGTGYIELDRASMLSDLAPGRPGRCPS